MLVKFYCPDLETKSKELFTAELKKLPNIGDCVGRLPLINEYLVENISWIFEKEDESDKQDKAVKLEYVAITCKKPTGKVKEISFETEWSTHS